MCLFYGLEEEPTHYVIDAVYELFICFLIDKSEGGVLDKFC